MQDSTLSETGNQYIFLIWVASMWEWGVNLNKDVYACFVLREACVLNFYWERETMMYARNQNGVELKHYIVICSITILNICFVYEEI